MKMKEVEEMTWWRVLLGLPEKTDATVAAQIKAKYAGMSACERQKAFMHDNWDLFPESIKEHIKRYDLIKQLEDERSHFSRIYAYTHERVLRNIEIARESREIGYKAYGITRLIREYEAQLVEAGERLLALPEAEELYKQNKIIEEKMKALGWSCTYGTGGLHWNKKGVIEDGYGVYD